MTPRGSTGLDKPSPEARSTIAPGRAALLPAGIFVLVTLFFLWVDRVFAEWMPDGEILFITLGFLILSLFYSQKPVYLQKYGSQAYPKAFTRFAGPGLAILFASLLHLAYMPGPLIPDLWWKDVLIAAGWLCILASLLLLLRGIQAAGLDRLTMRCVYFPEGDRLLDSKLYGFLRHPNWSGMMHLGFGLALVSGGWFSLLVAILLPLGFSGWIRLVEEKELLERFGQAYAEYRKRVPAFWVKPRDFPAYVVLMVTGA